MGGIDEGYGWRKHLLPLGEVCGWEGDDAGEVEIGRAWDHAAAVVGDVFGHVGIEQRAREFAVFAEDGGGACDTLGLRALDLGARPFLRRGWAAGTERAAE